MGNETILYYVYEETITGCKKSIKRHFWQKIKPRSFVVEDENISVVVVMIPTNDKGLSRKKLLDIMNRGIAEYADYLRGAKVVMQPAIQELLGQQEGFQTVFWTLAEKLFVDNFSSGSRQQVPESDVRFIDSSFFLSNKQQVPELVVPLMGGSFLSGNRQQVPESVVLLMGDSFFPEEQIERFTDMMQPHFSRINYLTIMYEIDDAAEIGMERWKEAIDGCVEMLYYEYGLVVDVYQGERDAKQGIGEENAQEQMHGRRMGYRHGQLRTLYVDYGYRGKLPYAMMRAGGVYIDVLSSMEKEQRIKKKCLKISYLSPMKYLDTMAKSGYDRLVN